MPVEQVLFSFYNTIKLTHTGYVVMMMMMMMMDVVIVSIYREAIVVHVSTPLLLAEG